MNECINFNEISSVKHIVSSMIEEIDFNDSSCVNNQENADKYDFNSKFLFPNIKNLAGLENAKFISIQNPLFNRAVKALTEEEFYQITGCSKDGITSKCGIFQEYLYGHYEQAKAMNDDGYIADVFIKAAEFKDNLNYIKSLSEDKEFASKWRSAFGRKSPVQLYKDTGSMRVFHMLAG